MELLSRHARLIAALVIDGLAIGYPVVFALVAHSWRARGRVRARQLAPATATARSDPAAAAAPRRVPQWSWRAPTLIEIWAESAWWQALINSGQLATAEWLPAGTQTSLAMARFREAMVT